MPDVYTIIKELGIPIGLVIYFLWKDYQFTERIVVALEHISDWIDDLQEIKMGDK